MPPRRAYEDLHCGGVCEAQTGRGAYLCLCLIWVIALEGGSAADFLEKTRYFGCIEVGHAT